MKKITKLLSVLLALSVILAGCGSTEQPTQQPANTGSATPEAPASNSAEPGTGLPGEGKTISILMMSVADEFIYACYQTAESRAKELGFNTVFVDAKNDAATQAAAVEDAITKKVDGVLMAPVDAAAMSDSVIKLNEAGIPVTLIDRKVNEGHYVAACESNNISCGYDGGVQLVEAAKKAGMAVSDLKVLELQGDLASTSGLERSQGFQQAAKELGFSIVSSLPTYWQTDTAYNAALDALQANPDINAIYLASDGVMADAVLSALEQVNKLFKVGEDGHIIVVTVDGTPGVIEHIRNGYVDVTAAQPAIVMTTTAVDKLADAIMGKIALDADEYIAFPPTIGTIENIDSDELWANNLD